MGVKAFCDSSSFSPRHSPSTCSRRGRRSKKYLIGVQAIETTPLRMSFLKGVSPGGVFDTERERENEWHYTSSFYLDRALTHTSFGVLLWTERSQQTRGRQEGREGERRRGDELSETERVVKLRLVQTKTGETRQLWKPGRGQLQVSLPLRNF